MQFHTTPFSLLTSLAGGIIGGEAARGLVSLAGGNESDKRIATFIGHSLGAAGAGYLTNAAGLDAGGAILTTAQAPTTAAVHAILSNTTSPLIRLG